MANDSVRRRRPPFAMVPERLLDSGLSDRAVRLYVLLDRYADEHDKAWPSRATMAKRLSCSEDSIDRAVKELVAAGWLTVHRRAAERATNHYFLLDRPRAGSRTGAESGSRKAAELLAAPVRNKRESRTRDQASTASPLASLRSARPDCDVCGGAGSIELADGSAIQCECVRAA